MNKKIYIRTFGCQMDAVLYDYRAVSERDSLRGKRVF